MGKRNSQVNKISKKKKGSLEAKISEGWSIMSKLSEIREKETKIKPQNWQLYSLAVLITESNCDG